MSFDGQIFNCHTVTTVTLLRISLVSAAARRNATKLGLSPYKVNRKALDTAYSIAFPHSEPLNIGKHRTNRPKGKRSKKQL